MKILCLVLALQFAPSLHAQNDSHESQRKAYDEIYSTVRETFSSAPNPFLVRMMTGRIPGRALDVAMGQGRNALWLASRGWLVSGFDISPVAIRKALAEAAKRRLQVDAVVAPYETFDWGKEKWDLIVFSYFWPKDALPKVWLALKPGGLLLTESFHKDTGWVRPIGDGWRTNEAFQVLKDYRILTYEDVEDRQDWGLSFGATNRLVRVLAQKPEPPRSGCTWERRAYKQGESMCWGVGRWTCGAEGWTNAGRCGTEGQ